MVSRDLRFLRLVSPVTAFSRQPNPARPSKPATHKEQQKPRVGAWAYGGT